MPCLRHRRYLLLLVPLIATCASAQQPGAQLGSSLPPTPPTTITTPLAATPLKQETPSRRAEVTYVDGLLNVRADNSSLHQILRAIARRTGMKITGGVADQRVFGDYGPASPSAILSTLLDGTGVNMLFRTGDTTGSPAELVLTPRTGAATPPSADTNIAEDTTPDDNPAPIQARAPVPETQPYPQQTPAAASSGPVSIPQPFNNVLGSPSNTTPTASQIPTAQSVSLDSIPTPSTAQQPAQGIVDSPNPPPAGTNTNPPSAPGGNGPVTPEQIYQQLLQLQKRQQAAPATPPATTPQ